MRRLLLRRKACRLTQPCVQLNEQNGLLGMAAALRQRVGKADGGLIAVGVRLVEIFHHVADSFDADTAKRSTSALLRMSIAS